MEQRWRGRFPVTLKQCISAHQPCVSERAAPAAPAAYITEIMWVLLERSRRIWLSRTRDSLKAFSKRSNHVPLNRQTASTGAAKVAAGQSGGESNRPAAPAGLLQGSSHPVTPWPFPGYYSSHSSAFGPWGCWAFIIKSSLWSTHVKHPPSPLPPTAACCSLTLSGIVISAIRTRGVFSIRGPC